MSGGYQEYIENMETIKAVFLEKLSNLDVSDTSKMNQIKISVLKQKIAEATCDIERAKRANEIGDE